MKKNSRISLLTQVTIVLFLMGLWAQPVNAQPVNAHLGAGYITIDPPQSKITTAYGINDHRKIVGTYYDAGGLGHGFLRNEDGRFVTIDHPDAITANGFGTEARGINSAGQIVGDYCDALPCDGVSVIKGYLLTGNTRDYFDRQDFKTLETPGHVNSFLQRINSQGDMVGCEHDTDTATTMHGIVRDDAKVVRYPVPFSMINGINKWEDFVGFHFDLTAKRANGFLLRKGVTSKINFPGAHNTLAWDINDRDQIVGFYVKNGGSPQGFLWEKGNFTSIDIPGARATFVFGINSAGDIVGEYDDATTAHGFLLCNRDHADAEGCGEEAQSTTAVLGQTSQSQRVTLPENVRQVLLQRPGIGQFGAVLVDPLER